MTMFQEMRTGHGRTLNKPSTKRGLGRCSFCDGRWTFVTCLPEHLGRYLSCWQLQHLLGCQVLHKTLRSKQNRNLSNRPTSEICILDRLCDALGVNLLMPELTADWKTRGYLLSVISFVCPCPSFASAALEVPQTGDGRPRFWMDGPRTNSLVCVKMTIFCHGNEDQHGSTMGF